jgi:hypothetical protein
MYELDSMSSYNEAWKKFGIDLPWLLQKSHINKNILLFKISGNTEKKHNDDYRIKIEKILLNMRYGL